MAGGAWGPCARPGLVVFRISNHASSATFIGGGFCLHARSHIMSKPYSPAPKSTPEAPAPEAAQDPNSLIAILHSIGAGAASDGQPWPERHPLPWRRVALADADCALAGQRVIQEILLAAERTRQNGDPDQYVGDRVMEGLAMACLALTIFIQERVRPAA